MRTAGDGAGLRLQRDGGADGLAGLSDLVAGRRRPQPVVSTLNALDGAITSNMAIVPRRTARLMPIAVRDHATDPRHLQLLRAVGRRFRFSRLISSRDVIVGVACETVCLQHLFVGSPKSGLPVIRPESTAVVRPSQHRP